MWSPWLLDLDPTHRFPSKMLLYTPGHAKIWSESTLTVGSWPALFWSIWSCNAPVHRGIHRDTISRSSMCHNRRKPPGLGQLRRARLRAHSCGLVRPGQSVGLFWTGLLQPRFMGFNLTYISYNCCCPTNTLWNGWSIITCISLMEGDI